MLSYNNIQKQEIPKINQTLSDICETLPEHLQEIISYALLAGGKRLRPLLTIYSAKLFGYTKPDIYKLAACIELTHAASLLHDDILDKAVVRHAKEAAHIKFGTTATVLAGDAMLAKASQIISTFEDIQLCASLANAVFQTTYGEILEIYSQGSLDHSIDKYIEIISGKTAYLLRTACELGAIRAGASSEHLQNICQYGLNLGIAFQIIDDALDFADEKITGKPTAGDLREAKMTPPIKQYANSLNVEDYQQFSQKFKTQSFNEADIQAISSKISELGLENKTRILADQYLNLAKAALETLPKSSERKLLSEVLSHVRDRKK